MSANKYLTFRRETGLAVHVMPTCYAVIPVKRSFPVWQLAPSVARHGLGYVSSAAVAAVAGCSAFTVLQQRAARHWRRGAAGGGGVRRGLRPSCPLRPLIRNAHRQLSPNQRRAARRRPLWPRAAAAAARRPAAAAAAAVESIFYRSGGLGPRWAVTNQCGGDSVGRPSSPPTALLPASPQAIDTAGRPGQPPAQNRKLFNKTSLNKRMSVRCRSSLRDW